MSGNYELATLLFMRARELVRANRVVDTFSMARLSLRLKGERLNGCIRFDIGVRRALLLYGTY